MAPGRAAVLVTEDQLIEIHSCGAIKEMKCSLNVLLLRSGCAWELCGSKASIAKESAIGHGPPAIKPPREGLNKSTDHAVAR